MPAAADVAALVRSLNAATVSETTKLETARTLVSFFVSASGPSNDVQPRSTAANDRSRSLAFDVADLCSMPSRVRGHYVKLLLDWVATALTKAKHDSSSNDDASTYLQQLQQRWQLLFVLLASTDSPPQSAPNTTLVAAAAVACKGCSIGHMSGADGQKLALVLQQTLLVLNTKYSRSFRPSLDHSIALATGSLAHVISCRHMAPPPASLKAWEGLATQACIQLLEVCTSHPNQKKVYTAVVNKPLLLLLSQAIWPPTQQTNPHPQAKHLGNDPTGNDPAANKNADHKAEHPSGTVPTTANMAAPHGPGIQLTAVARELILSVVFHSSSIDGIIELGTSFSNSSHKPGGIAADKAAKVSAPRSYHYQLLQVIDEILSCTPDAVSAEGFMHFLSWLATQFAHTVKHPSRSSSPQQQPSQRAATASTVAVSAPLSADFYFFATLLQPLLSHMQADAPHCSSLLPSSTASGMTNFAGTNSTTGIAQAAAAAAFQPKQKKKGQQAGKGRAQTLPESHGLPVEWAVAAKGAALMVAAMQVGNVYRPTEDTTGRHRQLLIALADAALQRAKRAMQHTSGAAGADSVQQKELVAVCNMLSAILSVEHRAVQPHLAHIWQLLWLAARGHDAQAIATAVATGLVAAYADLRQLQFLLQSLLGALLVQQPPTAADVLCEPPFVQALQKAVREMPSGQAAPMIAFIAHHIPALAALPGGCPQAASEEALASCLTSIRVEVVSAPSLATAAAALLPSSLGPVLTPILLQINANISSTDASHQVVQTSAAEAASRSAAAQLPQHVAAPNSSFEAQHAQQAAVEGGSWLQRDVEGSEQLMGCLLRLYRGAVGLYGQCAATQLQIAQLPGQGTGLFTNQPSQQPETGGRNGYFTALLPAGQLHTAPSLPALPSLLHPAPHSQACNTQSPLTTQLCLCATQQIVTLHEQLLHQQYTCPLIFADPTTKAAVATTANPLVATDAPTATTQAASIADSRRSAATPQLSNEPMADMLVGDPHHGGSEGKVPPKVTPEVAPEVTSGVATEVWDDRMNTEGDLEVTASIQTELKQLSDQVLWHAAALLQPQTGRMSSGMTNSRAAQQPQSGCRKGMPTDFWPVVSPLLPTLAMYATQPSLQNFLRQLMSCYVPDPALASGSASDPELSSASSLTSGSTSGSTSASTSDSTSSAAAAGVIAGCLGQASFLEQPQLQQAWLHVTQQELSSAVTALTSAAASSSESQHAQRGSTSKKRKKSQGAQSHTDAVMDRAQAEGGAHQEGGWVTDAQLHTVLMQTLQVVTPFLASHQAAAAPAAGEATVEAAAVADGQHTSSSSKVGSAARKRKPAEGPLSEAAQAIPMLRHVTGLLRHVALMPLAMLSARHAALLAQNLLQTQLLLAQSAITLAAAGVKADSDALELMVQALLSSQQGIARCLKGSSDAAAGLLLHAGPPQLWRWLPAAAQLTGCLQSLTLPSSTMGLSAALPSHAHDTRSTISSASEQLLHKLAAGRKRAPDTGSNAASCMGQFASTCMLQEMSSSIRSLALFCLRIHDEAKSADIDFGGFRTFIMRLVNELQAGSIGLSPQGQQSCEGNSLDVSASGITWVMAEAVLAAAEQAASACVPVKRKKAAAEVVTGPLSAANIEVDPQLLASTVSSLKVAVGAHMRHHTASYALAPPGHASQSAPPDGDAYDMPRVLHGLDSTTMAAAFGCAAHLLHLHRKSVKYIIANPRAGGEGAQGVLSPSSAVTPSVTPTSGKLQQPTPAQKTEGATAAGHVKSSDDADKDGHMGNSHDAEVLEHVTSQVEWLTNILKLPWQLQSAGTHLQPGRMALSIASAHHLVAFLQAVPQAALHVEPGVGQLLWLSLHTLHLHMLATLTPVLEAPLPLRHAGSAPMGLPTLVPPSQPHVKPYTALRKALLLSLREVYRATTAEQQQRLYTQLVQALNAAQSPLDALAVLEGLLVALETPHSPKGLHVLARHSQSFASALLHFISSVTSPSTKAGTAAAAAAAAAAEVAAAVATAHRCLESMLARDNIFTLPPSQIVDTLASPAFVFTSAIGRTLNNSTSPGQSTLAAMAPVHGGQCEAGAASGACWPDGYSVRSGVQVGGLQWGLRQGAGVYMGCCSLIMAGLRHHAGAVRRCMALVGPSTRALLKTLMLWSQPQSSIRVPEDESLLVVCATELAQLYTTIAADKAGLGKYCVHLLADYITVAAAPPLPPATSLGVSVDSSDGWQLMEPLSGLPGAALRQGALALYGACSPAEVQHIHAMLAGVSDGMQRAALADLRRDYEADYRYTGKV